MASLSYMEQIAEALAAIPQDDLDAALEEVRSELKPSELKIFDEMMAIAKARVDMKSSIEFWYKTPQGKPLKLRTVQRFILDFVELTWGVGKIPIINGPMGIGKTILATGIVSYRIGKDPNIRTQIVCASDDGAQERGALVASILISRDYQKVFSHIEKDGKKPWNAHKINVKRSVLWSDADEEEIRDSDGAPISINATMTAYGVGSAALGSRSELSVFDDIPTYENSIKSPGEGEHINNMLNLKWLSRRESPIGLTDKTYDVSKDPWRGLFINTPWHDNDCIFRRRKSPSYATVVIGVNDDFTGYNVEIWNLPEACVNELRSKYQLCKCGHEATLHNELTGPCKGDPEDKDGCSCEAVNEMTGGHVYMDFPAHHTMTTRLERPSIWYKERYAEDSRDFNRKYRCIVYSDQERAFPAFTNALVSYRLDRPGIFLYRANREPLFSDRNGKLEETGSSGVVQQQDWPPGLKFAAVDLSTASRRGTVITVGVLTTQYRRVIIEVARGGWAGDEITEQLDRLHKRHPDLENIWVESAAQQALFISEIIKHKETYPWWYKVQPFITSAKTKNDQVLGVLNMATAFQAGVMEIPDSTIQPDHPVPGDPGFPDGCPCGMCTLIRDCKIQTRGSRVESDCIMSLWMLHSSMPQSLEMPTGIEPSAFQYTESGYLLFDGRTESEWDLYHDYRSTTEKAANERSDLDAPKVQKAVSEGHNRTSDDLYTSTRPEPSENERKPELGLDGKPKSIWEGVNRLGNW